MRNSAALTMIVVASLASACAPDLDGRPRNGEAQIRYLGHAGWMVRTSEHTLVFDYTGATEGGTLDDGILTPEALAGQTVLLFVSHAHGDHFRRQVLDLRDTVEGLTVVMGWDEPDSGVVTVPPDGEWIDLSGAKVFALHHAFDDIPEGFFLVRSGGLTIYHSGDHGTWSIPASETFRANIDRLAAEAESIDIAFISSFGMRSTRQGLNAGDVYSIEALQPKVTFPMHCGDCEDYYQIFADDAAELHLPTLVGVADAPGASFRFRNGTLAENSQGISSSSR